MSPMQWLMIHFPWVFGQLDPHDMAQSALAGFRKIDKELQEAQQAAEDAIENDDALIKEISEEKARMQATSEMIKASRQSFASIIGSQ